jgi:CRISPR-associated protein Cst2
MRAKFLELAFLSKLEKTNVNASGVEGNITVLKKTEDIDGTQRVYISGASIKYAIKTYLEENGWTLSQPKAKTKTAQITTQCDPKKYIDDDLFGYLDTDTDKKRVAPVKTNGMISLFPYKGDLNRGVRFDPEGKQHSMYDIEILTNVFRSNWAIELDRIGYLEDDGKILPANERDNRVKALMRSILNLWSRVKKTNFLTKMNPEVLVMLLKDDKSISIGDKLKIDQKYNLDITALEEALVFSEDSIKEAYIAGMKSFINNWKDVKERLGSMKNVQVMDMTSFKKMILGGNFNFYR